MEGNVVVIYNVAHEPPLGLPIAIYFYLTGLSAGSFILSTLAYGFGLARFKSVGKVGVVAAVLLLVLAPLNLIADLGQPLRAWHLFPYLSFTSPITYGSFLLTLYPLNCLVYGFFMFRGDILTLNFSPIFLGLELLLGSVLPVALLLIRPRAYNVLALAVATGALAVALVMATHPDNRWLTIAIAGSPAAVLLLLTVPPRDRHLASSALAAVLVMVGIMAMRYIMVIGGQSIPLS